MILVYIMLSKVVIVLYIQFYIHFHLNLMYPFLLKYIINFFNKHYCK